MLTIFLFLPLLMVFDGIYVYELICKSNNSECFYSSTSFSYLDGL